MNASVRFSLAFLVALVLAGALGAQSRCSIEYVDDRGRARNDDGYAESHTFRGLSFQKTRSGSARLITPDSLIRVIYDKKPEGYEAAEKALAEGAFRNAAEGFLAAINDIKGSTEWALQECLYHASRAYAFTGDVARAKQVEDRLLNEVPETYHLPSIQLRRAGDLYAFGEFADAVAAYDEVATAGARLGYGPSFVTRGLLGKARVLMETKKYDDAGKVIATASTSIDTEEGKNRLELAKARLDLERGNVDAARSKFKELHDKAAKLFTKEKEAERHSYWLAGAFNGLGDSDFEQGKFEDARKQFSKTFTLYNDNPALDDQVGWALWRFSQASKRLFAVEGIADEVRKEYRRDHERFREMAARQYRMTRGGQLARQELGFSR